MAGQIKCCPDNGPETRVHTRITSHRYRSTSDLNNAPWVSSAPGNNQSVRNRTPRFDQARVVARSERKRERERGGMRAQVRSDSRLAMQTILFRSFCVAGARCFRIRIIQSRAIRFAGYQESQTRRESAKENLKEFVSPLILLINYFSLIQFRSEAEKIQSIDGK